MCPRYRSYYYVKDALKSRVDRCGPAGFAIVHREESGTHMRDARFCNAAIGPPPPPSGFQSLLKMQAGNVKVASQHGLSQSEAMSAN